MFKSVSSLTGAIAIASILLFSKASISSNEDFLITTYKEQINNIDPKSSPYDLVESLSQVVFASVVSAKSEVNEQRRKELMTLIVKHQLLPFVDIRFAAYKILGPQLKQTSKEQRDHFVDAMEKNLLETYSSALAQYNNQDVRYEPARDVTGQKMVSVQLELLQDASKAISMVFKLRKNAKTEEWRAFDLVVEGISLIDSKRAELSQPLRNKGIDDVSDTLLED